MNDELNWEKKENQTYGHNTSESVREKVDDEKFFIAKQIGALW
jgi:hypothetical protein